MGPPAARVREDPAPGQELRFRPVVLAQVRLHVAPRPWADPDSDDEIPASGRTWAVALLRDVAAGLEALPDGPLVETLIGLAGPLAALQQAARVWGIRQARRAASPAASLSSATCVRSVLK